MLIDQYNRTIDYLRLSVTDRCNLRCFYCMPEEGIRFADNKNILSFEEMLQISSLLTTHGIRKIRITGGEPFVRRDLCYFLKQLVALSSQPEVTLTTNATLIHDYIEVLKQLNIKKINISLDSLHPIRFYDITRRNDFKKVYDNLRLLLSENFEVKVNCVVMEDKNIDDLIPLAELSKHQNLSIRFLEEMPFNAGSGDVGPLHWNHIKILRHLTDHFGALEKAPVSANSTSRQFRIKGYKGEIGIIPSFSRTFCGTCNRLRISATGELRTCLYGAPALNLKTLLRTGTNDQVLLEKIKQAIYHKAENGLAAEAGNSTQIRQSMSYLGG